MPTAVTSELAIDVLLLEHSRFDADLIEERLRAGGLEPRLTRVEDRDDFVKALEEGPVHVILSNLSLPSYDGLSALETAKRIAPGVPFLFVSGALGEELAIDMLHRGATDYVLKHRLDRLAPAVRRALAEASEREGRRRAEAERDALLVRERAARREAEATNRAKDEFLAVLSHELRTPLNAMLGWLHLLRAGSLPEDRRERALETIERSAKSQAQLVEDLLDMSRIIKGKLRLEAKAVDLASVIEAVADSVRPAAKAKAIAVRLDLDPRAARITGDPYRMQQVVWNLVSNAIKFTPPSGLVDLRLSRVSSSVEIAVADTGVGIDPDFLPHVFERFSQADGVLGRRHGGLGLGLAIVKHIAEMHGGTARAESLGLGLGATFVVTVPIERKAGDAGRGSEPPELSTAMQLAIGAPPSKLAGLRALLVDEDAEARGLVTAILEQRGMTVTAVGSAGDALRALSREAPDVLISDAGVPVIDGYTLVRKVRSLADERGRRIPTIALTARARDEDGSGSALQAGFQMHVPKPVDPEYLTTVLSRLTSRDDRG